MCPEFHYSRLHIVPKPASVNDPPHLCTFIWESYCLQGKRDSSPKPRISHTCIWPMYSSTPRPASLLFDYWTVLICHIRHPPMYHSFFLPPLFLHTFLPPPPSSPHILLYFLLFLAVLRDIRTITYGNNWEAETKKELFADSLSESLIHMFSYLVFL